MGAYKINVQNPVYAKVQTDTANGTTYGPVKSLGEAMQVQITPAYASGSLYGNGGQVDSSAPITGIALALDTTRVSLAAKKDIYELEEQDGIVITKAGKNASYIAVGYQVDHTDGTKELVWLLKGRPQPMNESTQQQTENINYSTDTMTVNFVKRDSDGALKYEADTSDPELTVTQHQIDEFFTAGPSEPVAKTAS